MRWLSVACAVALFAACGGRTEGGRTVSVSILPQRYFVERIAGDRVAVNVMVPPGASPASMDLGTRQLEALYGSSIYFAVGRLPFELASVYPLLEEMPSVRLVRQAAGESGEEDPHVWMSPRGARQMADSVFAVLSAYFPSDSLFFRRNYEGLVQEMDSIDRAARQIAERKRHGVFLIYHPALTYFARDYGMRQIAIEEEGKEPNPVHMKAIIDTCRAEGVRVVFIQSQFDQANAMTIAREIGGEVVQIDPLAGDWKAEMLRLLDVVDRKMD